MRGHARDWFSRRYAGCCRSVTTRIGSLSFDANEPLRLARFWAAALSWDIYDEAAVDVGLMPTDGTRFLLAFLPVPESKTEKNRIHIDLVSESPQHQAEMVARLTSLGARQIDIGQGTEADHVVLSDPEGNEFVCPERRVVAM